MWWQYYKQLWEARLDRLTAYLKILQARGVNND
ncbi:hypothetical protein ASTA108788_17615 [Asticcacaulis taihuensis]